MDIKNKNANIENIADDVITFIASKEVIDRDGDIVYIDGINTADFMKNPVFLKSHDAHEFPIGKVVDIAKTTGADGVKQLIAKVKFADTEEGSKAYYLYKEGFLNAVSIRFGVEKYTAIQNRGYDVFESKLYEISAVALPANQEALIIKGMKYDDDIKAISDKSIELKSIADRLEIIEKTISKPSVSDSQKSLNNVYAQLFNLADYMKSKVKKEENNG